MRHEAGTLLMSGVGPDAPMIPVSPSRFLRDLGGTTFTVEFTSKDGAVVSFTVIDIGFTARRVR